MRRIGRLLEAIADDANLRLAWIKARKGKGAEPEVRAFGEALDTRLAEIRTSLLDGSIRFGAYRSFIITDPKERVIQAAAFPERVAHHALMNVLDPVFERFQVHDSYACRRGKGTAAAVLRAFHFSKSQKFFLKMDVRSYFASIDHSILKAQLRGILKDPVVLSILDRIIDSYHSEPGKGLPIGNLTSQYFANHYLAQLDHWVGDSPGGARWVRYMDDMLYFGNSRSDLKTAYAKIDEFCGMKLGLALKPMILDRTAAGVPFLGFRVAPAGIFLLRATKTRFCDSYRSLEHAFHSRLIGEREFSARACSLCAHLELARSLSFRQNVIHGCVLGLEPRDSRRQLEQ